MSAARTDWKSLPLEEKPLKERKRKPPSDEGGGQSEAVTEGEISLHHFNCVAGKGNRALSPSQLR